MGCILFSLLPSLTFAQEGTNISCDSALEIAESVSYYTGDFSQGGLVESANIPICMTSNQGFPIREYWFKFTSDGISNYFFYVDGIVGAMEIYSGKCRELDLENCYPSFETTCYAELLSPPEATYFVRLVGLVLPNLSTYTLNFNSVDPTPICNISIDYYNVYPCVSDDGKVAVAISGSLDNWDSYISPFVEIETDEGTFFTYDVQTGNTWTANIEVEGTFIYNIVVAYGNSSNYCTDVVSNIQLPTQPCGSTPASLTGIFDWNSSCLQRPGQVSLYQPGTTNLAAYYNVDIGVNGAFVIEYPLLGTYDIIVKVDGYLPKGYPHFFVQNTSNIVDCGELTAGELNGDSFISIMDASLLNVWFNMATDPASPEFDLNCDGFINVLDISLFGTVFGHSGDTAPLGDN